MAIEEVGLGPGHIVLDGDPAILPKKGQKPQLWPIFIVFKRLDASIYHLVWTYRPRPRLLCVRWGPNRLPKRG